MAQKSLSPKELSKKNTLFIVLGSFFLTNAILAELIGVKIFSLESALGLAPAQLALSKNFVLDFNLTAGVIIWPVVFIVSDIINEYFGVRGVRKISYITAGLICYVFLIIVISTELPPADFWLSLNATAPSGEAFDIDYAFSLIFRQGLGIIIGSIIAFLIGQLVDAYTFDFIRRLTRSRIIWLRATGSTLVSQLIDSFVVLFVAFYVFGNWSWEQIMAVSTINYIYKFAVAIALTPILYALHHYIDRYLGKDLLSQMEAEAVSSSKK
ncbi:MAG: queuosine precursor transporter [Bernardetiaceae bacterium]|nr:queuosine precursor transporter [Bernardetiaceae bacterium]